MKPLVSWNEPSPIHKDLIWCARLDNRYQVEVQRSSPDKGLLCIFDYRDNMNSIIEQEVVLAYGAVMGPDSDDVLKWMDVTEKVIFAHQYYE